MVDIWAAAKAGDVHEVERLLGQDPDLLNARSDRGMTPWMLAALQGHTGVVRLLLDQGAAINEQANKPGRTALWFACLMGRLPVVSLLMERGADPTTVNGRGSTPLMEASSNRHVEVVRLLLGDPSGNATINQRDEEGKTALFWACRYGREGVVRALLESGADPTIADNDGTTPMAVAKQNNSVRRIVEGRRECVAALEVSCSRHRSMICLSAAEAWGVVVLGHGGWQEAERAYLLWKAREVADQQGSGAVAVEGGKEGEEGEALVDFAVHRLKGDLFPDLMEYMG
jgi:uncharacterized protein